MTVKCQPDETLVFSWITWPSREVRDDDWKKCDGGSPHAAGHHPMPFDGNRLVYGGFQILVEAWAHGRPKPHQVNAILIPTYSLEKRRCPIQPIRPMPITASWCSPA